MVEEEMASHHHPPLPVEKAQPAPEKTEVRLCICFLLTHLFRLRPSPLQSGQCLQSNLHDRQPSPSPK
jgi:hypothetical protein